MLPVRWQSQRKRPRLSQAPHDSISVSLCPSNLHVQCVQAFWSSSCAAVARNVEVSQDHQQWTTYRQKAVSASFNQQFVTFHNLLVIWWNGKIKIMCTSLWC